jgi:hypothetical protein
MDFEIIGEITAIEPIAVEGVKESGNRVIPSGARNLALVRNLFQW